MARILAYPFRITPAGAAATVEQNSPDGDTEQLAVLILTRRGERPLVSHFGLPDPAFAGVEVSELVAQVAKWGPPVKLTDVTVDVDPATPDVANVRVVFA